MIISNLGTQNGKIKVVIADVGFFAYDNILLPLNCRIIPVIKVRSNIDVEKLKKRIENYPETYSGLTADITRFYQGYLRISVT